jgi:hypothetical protein
MASKKPTPVDWSFLDDEKPKPKETKTGRPSMKEAILASCARCMGDYIDGMDPCTDVTCPLYYWMPYRDQEPDLSWRTTSGHRRANRKQIRFELERAKYKRQAKRESK